MIRSGNTMDLLEYIELILNEKKLTYKERKALPKKQFVFPDEGRYPIHDRKHAANALARVTQFGTSEEQKKVRKAVCSKYPDLPYCQKMKGKK